MSKKSLTRWFALAALTVGLAAPALARPPRGERGERFAAKAAELGVDAATIEQIKTIRKEARAGHGDDRGDMKAAHEALRAAMKAGDEKAALQAADAMNALKGEKMKDRVRAGLKVRALLTAEQWEALESMRGHGERGEGRRGEGRRGRVRGHDGPPGDDLDGAEGEGPGGF